MQIETITKKSTKTVPMPVIKNDVTHWVCQETGEVIEANEIIKPINRNGFMITYLSAILELIEVLGNKKMQIVKYILANMDKSTNTYLTTTRELAAATNSSTKTVTETIKILRNANIISKRTGAIMINPNLIHRGNQQKEQALITRFSEFDYQIQENEHIHISRKIETISEHRFVTIDMPADPTDPAEYKQFN